MRLSSERGNIFFKNNVRGLNFRFLRIILRKLRTHALIVAVR
jgi:hypothetical protein